MPTSVRDVGSGCPIAVVPPSITNNQVGKMRLRVSSHCYELRQVIFTHSKLFIRQPPTKQFIADFLGQISDVRCPEGIDLPMPVIAVGHQSTDTNNGVVDVLGEFISHCLANLMVGLAVVSIGGGKASEVRDRFDVPNDEMVRHRSSKLMVPKESSGKLAGDAK